MAAGIAALEELATGNAYSKLEQLGAALEGGMKNAAKAAGVPVQFNRCGSMFCAYFTGQAVHNLADALQSDRERFKHYFMAFGPRRLPRAVPVRGGASSTAHTDTDIENTVQAAARVMGTLR
jgi:glutamate-1-semialdehyde 2,1-aminomutase